MWNGGQLLFSYFLKGGRKMKKALFTSLLFTIATLALVPISYSQYVITQITDNSYNDWEPQINNNGYVVWQGWDGSDDEIFLAVLAVPGGGPGWVSTGEGGRWLITTAAYGSRMAEEVAVFEHFRDKVLLTNAIGKVLVSSYYKYSPSLADYVAKSPVIRKVVRIGLYPILGLSKWFMEESPTKWHSNRTE
jgi:hypothetical protein